MPVQVHALPRIKTKTKARRRRLRPPSERELFDLAFIILTLLGVGHGVLMLMTGFPIAGTIAVVCYSGLYAFLRRTYRLHRRLREFGFHLTVSKGQWFMLGFLYVVTLMTWLAIL